MCVCGSEQVFTRETPTWLPHATANKAASQPVVKRNRKVEDGADRIQTICDSQKRFAAQFSHPAVSRVGGLTAHSRMPAGSRWASKPEGPKAHSGCSPVGTRWSVGAQARDNHVPLASDLSRSVEEDLQGPLQYSSSFRDSSQASRHPHERTGSGGDIGGGGDGEGGSEGAQGQEGARQTKSTSGSKGGVSDDEIVGTNRPYRVQLTGDIDLDRGVKKSSWFRVVPTRQLVGERTQAVIVKKTLAERVPASLFPDRNRAE